MYLSIYLPTESLNMWVSMIMIELNSYVKLVVKASEEVKFPATQTACFYVHLLRSLQNQSLPISRNGMEQLENTKQLHM